MIFLISSVLASGFYARTCLAIDVGCDSTHLLQKSSPWDDFFNIFRLG